MYLYNNWLYLGSCCDTLGRVVTSDTRGPGFESRQRQSLLKRKIFREWPIFRNYWDGFMWKFIFAEVCSHAEMSSDFSRDQMQLKGTAELFQLVTHASMVNVYLPRCSVARCWQEKKKCSHCNVDTFRLYNILSVQVSRLRRVYREQWTFFL